jgi:hypothetical protein
MVEIAPDCLGLYGRKELVVGLPYPILADKSVALTLEVVT